jgi:hypothetical protein
MTQKLSARLGTLLAFWLGVAAAFANTPLDQALIVGRVLDAQTRQVIPCTVRILTSKHNVLTENPSFGEGFRSAGTFERSVPSGETKVSVTRGFDYVGMEKVLNLRPGEKVELTFPLERRSPLHGQGWYCGDNHAHMTHGERTIVVDFPYVALAGRAEGLDYLSIAQQWNLPRVDPESLEAACRAVSTSDFTLAWNMETPKNYWRGDASRCLGHGWNLAMRGITAEGQDAIQVLRQTNAGDYESQKAPVPNFEIHALIHSLDGIVSYTHPCRWWWGEWGGQGIYPLEEGKFISNLAQELPYDTVAGPTYDTIDILMQTEERKANEKAQQLWFTLLNEGYRIAATASSDTTFDNPGRGTPGKVRVYTRVEGPPTLPSLAHAMKSGRNFVTSGPLLTLEIGGHSIGDVNPLTQPTRLKASLEAWASGLPGEYLTKAEVLRNGKTLKTFDISGHSMEFQTGFEIDENHTAWYIARCFGSTPDQVAITNPIYFEGIDSHLPQLVLARVTGTVNDRESGKPLDGICEVISMVGLTPVPLSRYEFSNGRFVLEAPATARLQVRVPGYQRQTKSIFLDSPPLLNMTLNMHCSELIDWSTFEQLKELLRKVALKFDLSKEK